MHHNASSRTHNATRILLTSCNLSGKVACYCCAQVYISAVEMVAHIMERNTKNVCGECTRCRGFHMDVDDEGRWWPE